VICAVLVGVGGGVGVGSVAHADSALQSPAAAAGDHFWIAMRVPGRGERERLIHHHPSIVGPPLRDVAELSSSVRAVAAWDDRVWLLLAPGADPTLHEIVTVRAVPNPISGSFDSDPPGRLSLLPSLRIPSPAIPGVLLGFAAGADGPIAFVHDRSTLRIVAQAGTTWSVRESVALPEGAPLSVTAVGSDGRGTALLTQTPGGELALATRRAGEPWRIWPVADADDDSGHDADHADPASSLVRWDDAALVIRTTPSDVSLLRPTAIASIVVGRFDRPSAAWAVGGLRSGIVVVATNRDATTVRSAVSVRRLDPRSRSLGDDLIASAGSDGRARFGHIPILGAIWILVAMTVLLFRGDRLLRRAVLPDELVAADPARRLAALAIDFIPGALVARLVAKVAAGGSGDGGAWIDLLILPIWTVPWSLAMPSLVALAVTAAHSALTEAALGTSLGKWLFGLRVVRIDDGRSMRGAPALLRGVVRLVVLAMPLLAIFHVVNPQFRGLPEHAASAAVVGRRWRGRSDGGE